jgi:hypothetical protein
MPTKPGKTKAPKVSASKVSPVATTAKPSPEILEKFHKKLQESLLDDPEIIKDHHFTPMSAAGAGALGLAVARAGFKIPYFSPAGEETGFFRYRYLEDTRTGFMKATDAKVQRYGQLAGTLNEAYFSPALEWSEVLTSAEYDVWITEGELKAACACTQGIPGIGLGGVWCFKSTKLSMHLIPTLEQVKWEGRRVYICYDSDASSNPLVMAAEVALAKELTRLGAFPTIVRLPAKADGHKNGLDDYLVERGIVGLEQCRKEAVPFADAQILHRLNEEIVYVRDPGFVVRRADNQKIAPQAFTSHAYADRHITYTTEKGTLGRKSAPAEWLKWPGRAAVQGFTYAPGHPEVTPDDLGRSALNAWKGWGCESKKGDVAPWVELMDFMFKGFPDSRKWFERWLAYPIQHPGAKLATAVVLWGRMGGTGKSFIGESMQRVYGTNYETIGNAQLAGSFNGWSENKQFIMGEEISGMDKRGMMDRLKAMITEERVQLNIKYLPGYSIPSHANFYFVSNHSDALQLDDTDRRFFVHETPALPLPDEFYTGYRQWLKESDGKGPSALRYYFEHLDLGDFNPQARALKTAAKEVMVTDAMSEMERWLFFLQRDPDTALRVGSTIVKHRFWTAQGLLDIFDADGRSRTSSGGMVRALKRASLLDVGSWKTKDGYLPLWDLRPGPRIADPGAEYDRERGVLARPTEIVKAEKKTSTKGKAK